MSGVYITTSIVDVLYIVKGKVKERITMFGIILYTISKKILSQLY